MWKYSYKDIKFKVKLRLGYEQSKFFQDLQTLTIIANNIFGTGKKKVDPPKTKSEAVAKFAAMFGASAVNV